MISISCSEFLNSRMILGPTGKIQRKNLSGHFSKATTTTVASSSTSTNIIDRLALVKKTLAKILNLDIGEIKDNSTLFQLGK